MRVNALFVIIIWFFFTKIFSISSVLYFYSTFYLLHLAIKIKSLTKQSNCRSKVWFWEHGWTAKSRERKREKERAKASTRTNSLFFWIERKCERYRKLPKHKKKKILSSVWDRVTLLNKRRRANESVKTKTVWYLSLCRMIWEVIELWIKKKNWEKILWAEVRPHIETCIKYERAERAN